LVRSQLEKEDIPGLNYTSCISQLAYKYDRLGISNWWALPRGLILGVAAHMWVTSRNISMKHSLKVKVNLIKFPLKIIP
jgi:phosphate-selective porin